MNQRKSAIEIFLAGVESVKPDNLIHRFVSLNNDTLRIGELTFDLTKLDHIYVIGAGKASGLMAQSLETILGARITAGHIVTKYGHACPLHHITLTEAGHPVPDENGIQSTEKILTLAQQAGPNDLVICLLSGGGSALLTDTPDGCTLADLKTLNDALLKCGASIQEINCVRKHLSRVKGGQLAQSVAPATLVSLILSDVIGDPLDVIASGPTAPDPTTFGEALAILSRYRINDIIPTVILRSLQAGSQGQRPETPKADAAVFRHTHNLIVGTNRLALDAARQKAEALGYAAKIVTHTLDGNAAEAARVIVNKVLDAQRSRNSRPICLLFGGEPTVKVTGDGLGGRNQHLALTAASLLQNTTGITVLSGGSDGTDGPTDAAGAVVDAETSVHAQQQGLDIERYLERFDAYHFFAKEGSLIITGPTQTNVMDLMVALVH